MPYYVLVVVSFLITLGKGSLYDESRLQYFEVPRTSTLNVSSNVHKHGGRSLLWSWQPGDTLTLDLHHEPVDQKQLKSGGLKLWLYLPQAIPGSITVSFHTSFMKNYWRATYPECQFDISLDFTGWRGIWVAFEECRLWTPMLPFSRMFFQAPGVYYGHVYIDLLHIIRNKKLWQQSRDHIVPPILGRSSSPKEFWQQTYRFSLVKPKENTFNEIELNYEQFQGLKDIRLVRARLKEWFDARMTTHDLKGYYKTRWNRLKRVIKVAKWYYKLLNITRANGFIQGPPLFSRSSEYGEENIASGELKFGFIMQKILLPLSLEYFFLARKHEMNRVIKEELAKLNNPFLSMRRLKRLLDNDEELVDVFYKSSKVKVRRLSRRELWYALEKVNFKRFQRIILLLDYIMDQGWQNGSALGSLDHEMNRSSKGFVTTIFLLRRPLMKAGRLGEFIDIMKWYLEFGELYQDHYEYKGTTCDRMRTLMLYRLMCVTVMPEATLQESLDKLRDMDALRDWYENALAVNTGLGGVIKPDYTGYHHKSFYPNDYVLPALITASQVVYLLRGTGYKISETGRRNLRKVVHFMRVLSVKYTIPNSVANASPTNAKPELICLIPAFAYLAMAEMSTSDRVMSKQAVVSLRVFLRMLNESNSDVQAYLSKGSGCQWKSSFTWSLGSLALIYRLKRHAKELGIEAERSPEGNWAKNFAALAVHRRGDWAVTVKGFNNFVWGYESSRKRGNSYGVYQSYGQLIIANSDQAMRAYDIAQGWDWTRLPGTTTLRVPLKHLLLERSRYYNPKKLCGAVTFQGTSRFRNGAFVMDFQRPNYKRDDTEFSFKKSVFFSDDLIVCLGSNIEATRSNPVQVETTLFQNIGTIDEQVRSIKANGFEVRVRKSDPRRFIWGTYSPGMLLDVNGNGYYIRNAGKQNLNLWLDNQKSYHDKYEDIKTEGHFATAWLKHGTNPKGVSYDYAILVNTTYRRLHKFACAQEKLRGLPKYEVLQQNQDAHIVKFNNSPRVGLTTYAYSVFAANAQLTGPLWIVGDPCVLMVEHGGSKSTRLILGVSYPQLNFNTSRKLRNARDVEEEELFYMRSQEKRIWVLLRENVKATGYRVYVDGEPVDPEEAEEHVTIIPNRPNTIVGSLVYFKKLLNGFSTEVHFRRISSSTLS